MELAARATREGMAKWGPSYMIIFMIPTQKSAPTCMPTEHFPSQHFLRTMEFCSCARQSRIYVQYFLSAHLLIGHI